jgi:uncharacterized membrane protein (GlpM family)
MYLIITKYLISAGLVVLVSELAKRNEKIGALISAMPMVAILTLIWLYVEKQPAERIGNYASFTFWYVIPTLPLFLVFPALLQRFGFWLAMFAGIAVAAVCFAILAVIVRRFGIVLF